MTQGRKPKPTYLKVVEGNKGKRPVNKSEPKPGQASTMPPPYLIPEAKKIWKRLVPELKKLHLFTKIDRDMFAAYCTALARAKEADAAVTEHGLTYTSYSEKGGETIKRRPETIILTEQLKLAKALAAEFGLTPSSRTRFDGMGSEANDDEDFLFGRTKR